MNLVECCHNSLTITNLKIAETCGHFRMIYHDISWYIIIHPDVWCWHVLSYALKWMVSTVLVQFAHLGDLWPLSTTPDKLGTRRPNVKVCNWPRRQRWILKMSSEKWRCAWGRQRNESARSWSGGIWKYGSCLSHVWDDFLYQPSPKGQGP